MANKLNILIASGRSDVRDMTAKALRYIGFENIHSISLGRESIFEAIEKFKIDLAIVDNNGFKLRDISQFRPQGDDANSRKIKIILLVTIKIDIKQLKEGYSLGISSVLNYPFQMNELEKAVSDATRSVVVAEQLPNPVFDRIRDIDFFSFLSDTELLKLLKMCKCRNYRQGEVVFEENEPGDRFYVIINGLIDIVKFIDSNRSEVLARLDKGQVFGEMSIIDDSPRSARAVAATDTLMFELDKKIMDGYDDLITLKLFKKLGHIFIHRLRAADAKIKDLMSYQRATFKSI